MEVDIRRVNGSREKLLLYRFPVESADAAEVGSSESNFETQPDDSYKLRG